MLRCKPAVLDPAASDPTISHLIDTLAASREKPGGPASPRAGSTRQPTTSPPPDSPSLSYPSTTGEGAGP
jgi:hypothetical protein